MYTIFSAIQSQVDSKVVASLFRIVLNNELFIVLVQFPLKKLIDLRGF